MSVINMLSSAEKVKGQGVGSAYVEQLELIKEGLNENYTIEENSKKFADIMHYHTVDLSHYLALPIAKLKNSVTVGAVHFLPETMEGSLDLPKPAKNVFYKYLIDFYKSMDYLVTVNPNFIEKLCAYGIPREKIYYIPNYVSKEKFFKVTPEEKIKLRQQYHISPDAFVVLGVGQLQIRKGIFEFVEIAKQLKDVQFIWAGGFSFGSITSGHKEVKAILDNPPSNVQFTGIVERSEMNALYNIADVMFLPSYNELFPMTILEAMSCEIPILLRDLDIYPNILFDFYLKGNTNEEFITHLIKLKEDTAYRNKWIQKSIKGSAFYSKAHILSLWQNFYDGILLAHHNSVLKEEHK